MSNIIGTGFNAGSDNGEFDSLQPICARSAEMGVDTVELGRDQPRPDRRRPHHPRARTSALAALTSQFDFRYTVHGLVSSNFMDPVTLRYQIDAAKALVEVCDRIGARMLVQHGGYLRADQHRRARRRPIEREREALTELADFAQPATACASALENIFTTEPGQYRQTPAEVAETVKAVNHPNVVALIDFSHAYIESTYRGLDFCAEIAPWRRSPGTCTSHDSLRPPAGLLQAVSSAGKHRAGHRRPAHAARLGRYRLGRHFLRTQLPARHRR